MSTSARMKNRLRQSYAQGHGTLTQSSSTHSKPNKVKKETKNKEKLSISNQEKIEILDQVLAELETEKAKKQIGLYESTAGDESTPEENAVLAQVAPQATLDATDTLNPNQPIGGLKEAESRTVPEISPAEAGAGLQQVEYEKRPEIPTEVESYLKSVEADKNKSPNEIAITDTNVQTSSNYRSVKKPVLVLPITPEEEKTGKKKSIHWSLRWLVEWSQRLMKIFKGEIIYQN